jgi:hypothetical protein
LSLASIGGGHPSRQTDLELDADGSSYLRFGDLVNSRAHFGIDAQGLPALALFDKNSEQRATFQLTADGDPQISLWTKGEKAYGGMNLRQDGLTLTDEAGKVRAALGSIGLETIRTGATENTALGSLTLFDKKGHLMWQIPPR